MKLDKLKVCFVGVGSIGKRHINNLRILCQKERIDLTVDALRRKGSEKLRDVVLDQIYTDSNDMPCDYDVIFITNPTELHIETLKMIHNKGKHFFIEKPVDSFKNLESAQNFPYRLDSVYYVACPMRYEKILQYIKTKMDLSRVICARSICSSYLPNWRPGTDYRKTYSAHKELGGGVSIDLIHEWDYITWLFGYPKSVYAMIGKKSDLEIDSEDYALYIAEYENMMVELHLDYFGRSDMRELLLFTDEDTISCDMINGRIRYLNSGKELNMGEDRNEYQTAELMHFLDIICGNAENDNSPLNACRNLKLSQGII